MLGGMVHDLSEQCARGLRAQLGLDLPLWIDAYLQQTLQFLARRPRLFRKLIQVLRSLPGGRLSFETGHVGLLRTEDVRQRGGDRSKRTRRR